VDDDKYLITIYTR